MTEQTNAPAAAPAPAPAALSPEAAAQQRAALMGNADWRAKAMNPHGSEYAELSRLNQAIAAGMDAEAGADEAEAEAQAEGQPQQAALLPRAEIEAEATALLEEAPPGFFDAPERHSLYKLPTQEAERMGLSIDWQVETGYREGLFAAGADQGLADTLYRHVMQAATRRTPVQQAGERISTERELRQQWGPAYGRNLTLANNAARWLFESMPHSVTGGADFAAFMEATGIANNKGVITQLHQRALAWSRLGD